MKKLFLFLFAALMSVGSMMADTTVTWGATEFSSFGVDNLYAASRTVKGITVTVNAANQNFINVTEYGTTFNATIDNAFTFSTELGNITKIECTTLYTKGTLGDGWTIGANSATWEGNTNTLNFGNAGSMLVVSNIIFTIGDAEPEPEPEPAQQAEPIVVTWNSSNLPSYGEANSFTLDGVTLAGNSNMSIDWYERIFSGSGTFTTDLGNFTKIEITAEISDMNGEGWSGGTWTGNAASVSFNAYIYGYDSGVTFVFTIEPASTPEPEPEPAGDEITVTWNNPSGYGFEFTQDGVTLTCGEITYKDFYGPGTFTTELGNFTKIEVYAEGGCLFSGDGWSGDDNQKTWTGNAASVSFSYDIYVPTSIVFTIEPAAAPAGRNYNLTLADGSNEHGTVAFSVGGNAASQAKKDDVVTVSVTPNEGYSAKDVAARAYTSWEAASDILAGGNASLVGDINVAKNNEDGTWSFTMPAANVWVVVSYSKNLQDAWIQAIANQTYTGEAIEPAVVVMDGESVLVLNSDYTVAYSNNVNAGTATVTVTGIGNYSGTAIATFIIVDKSALNYAIIDAEEYHSFIAESYPDIAAALLNAINAAKDVRDNANATQEQVNDAVVALNNAMVTAEAKSALNDVIAEAEQYHNSIAESYPGIAATLLDAINAAKGVRDNADATLEQIEAAIAALNNAKADAALKRVIVVIPAKSYMARIDADKRQIEVAVEGVSLYSVQSVTNTEVILTDELNVIAAEMPYFIYNDNDTEMEVSLIVSNDDPDDVAYDSEHFKGTLVDKTFTDEDMAEKDYYVLSDNSFVWVMNAGTLAAGKCWIELGKSPAHAPRLIIVSKDEATGISNIEAGSATKVLRDGQVLILRGDKTYTVQGAEVK